MARKTERVVISGTQYQITQLGAVEGTELHHKFMAAIEPLLREVISGPLATEIAKLDGGDPNGELMRLIAPMFLSAFKVMPPALVTELRGRFMAFTKVGAAKDAAGKAIMLDLEAVFDDHFAGAYADYLSWFGHCVRINGFLALLGGGNAAQAAASQAAPSA